MPENENLTPEGTETEIEITEEIENIEETPAEAPQEDVAALRAERDAANAAKEVAERKFSESAREAQILIAKNKTLEARQPINNQPTDDDMRQSFPEWEFMTDNEKAIAKRTYVAEQTANEAVADKRQREAEAVWSREVESFVLSEQKLYGREDEFKKFVNKPSHRGVPLDVLKSAFFYETPAQKPQERTPGLETGSGGMREPQAKKWTADSVLNLRKNDPKTFHEKITSGEIRLEDIE